MSSSEEGREVNLEDMTVELDVLTRELDDIMIGDASGAEQDPQQDEHHNFNDSASDEVDIDDAHDTHELTATAHAESVDQLPPLSSTAFSAFGSILSSIAQDDEKPLPQPAYSSTIDSPVISSEPPFTSTMPETPTEVHHHHHPARRPSEELRNWYAKATEFASAAWELTQESLQSVKERARDAAISSKKAVDDATQEGFNAFSRERGVEELVIPAGSVIKLPVIVPKDSPVFWRILVKAFNISFGVNLRVQELGGAVEKEMEPMATVEAGELWFGSRKAADIDRHLLLVFDNSTSKLRSKTVHYQHLTGERAIRALELAEAMRKSLLIPSPQPENVSNSEVESTEKKADQPEQDITPTLETSTSNSTETSVFSGLLANVYASASTIAQTARTVAEEGSTTLVAKAHDLAAYVKERAAAQHELSKEAKAHQPPTDEDLNYKSLDDLPVEQVKPVSEPPLDLPIPDNDPPSPADAAPEEEDVTSDDVKHALSESQPAVNFVDNSSSVCHSTVEVHRDEGSHLDDHTAPVDVAVDEEEEDDDDGDDGHFSLNVELAATSTPPRKKRGNGDNEGEGGEEGEETDDDAAQLARSIIEDERIDQLLRPH